MPQKQKKKHGQAGFTMIEIIAVLTLVAFLMVLVAPNVIKNLTTGKINYTKSQIRSTDNLMEGYYLDNGCYPTTDQGLKALVEKPNSPPVPNNWNGPYSSKKAIPQDGWGYELKYVCPGEKNPDSYDLYSLGADNAIGGEGPNADIW